MTKKTSKTHAPSRRAVSGAPGPAADGAAFGGASRSTALGAVSSSPLSYAHEPLDLTALSDPNVGVSFKNLQKKDATTKAKALEDLQANISSLESEQSMLEEAILETWIKVYPRTSIDASRRVRQLAHTLQGQIAASCGKRLAKHMPTIVSAWLAGQYDNDKSVGRAAQESFKRVFATEEKMKNVWKVYQSSILEYTRDVILKESDYTLSDERTTSPDDASAKYSGVAGAAVVMVTNLLEGASETDLEKNSVLLDDLLREKKLWDFAFHADPFVRRAIYRLLVVVLAQRKTALNPTLISAVILARGLHASQTGSSVDYVRALGILSVELPDVWTLQYPSKDEQAALKHLCHFLKKGSQGGPEEFWEYIASLLSRLPPRIILAQEEDYSSKQSDVHPYSPVLSALYEGLNSRDEPRRNQAAAWSTYLKMSEIVLSSLPDAIERAQFLRVSVFPLVTQYVRPSPEFSRWAVASPSQQSISVRACNQTIQGHQETFKEEWHALSVKIIEDLKTSLPEQSKEYSKSQDSLSAELQRWYTLEAALLNESSEESIRNIITQCALSEIDSFVSVLKARNGKPYGAASALETSIRTLSSVVFGNDGAEDILLEFANDSLPGLLLSPSAKHLINVLNLLDRAMDIHYGFEKCIKTLADAPDSTAKSIALESLVSSPRFGNTESLLEAVRDNLRRAMSGHDEATWELVMAALGNPVTPKGFTEDVLATMTQGLSIEAETIATLRGLEIAVKRNEDAVKDFTLSPKGSELLSRILLLTDSPDESVSYRSKSLNGMIEGALGVSGASSQATNSMIAVVKSGLQDAGAESLSIDALVSQACKLLESASPSDYAVMAHELLPENAQWTSALKPFVTRTPNQSIATTNTLGAALCFVSEADAHGQVVPRDQQGYSSAFRIAQYIVKLVSSSSIFEAVNESQKIEVCRNMAMYLQLAGDNISVAGSMPLWESSDPDLESETVDSIAEAQSLLASWWTQDFIKNVQQRLLEDSTGKSTNSYYSARAYSTMTAEIAEIQGHTYSLHDETAVLKELWKSPNNFTAAAYIASAPGSKELLRVCNELLSDLTGKELGEAQGLKELILMNCIFSGQDEYIHEIPQQRLVFFIKHVVQQLYRRSSSASMTRGEIMRSLAIILPRVSDIYGSFWEEILEITQAAWLQVTSDNDLYEIRSSLRLLLLLSKRHMQESNDDLLDAWSEKKKTIANGLVNLLIRLSDYPDDSHQPRRTINELVARLLASLSQEVNIEAEHLYPVLASESATLQEAAFGLLHAHVPSVQEQVSVDKALSKDFTAHLPQELLSLILAAPSVASLADYNLERAMAPSLRSYLLSWLITFDHWQKASLKVQEDYVASLKEGTYVNELLDFIFSILVSDRPKPVDASKYEIENYNIGLAEDPEKDLHWLLIHLYYLCLCHLPFISKEWWRDSTSRQLSIAVEKWTEKYISPIIIASELSIVGGWAPSQATADQPLTVKVSTSTREITASIPIDEQTMTIAIHLPPSYPLARASVDGTHRVGVNEKKWRAWIINAQAVINFSSGGAGEGNALIDGLVAFRKNVTATMKGQTECAICYSVVSAERQLPSKRCGTCKNMFHGACLFKWFKSSNSSSCPLCRNAFNYS